jgi:hypothetical protein
VAGWDNSTYPPMSDDRMMGFPTGREVGPSDDKTTWLGQRKKSGKDYNPIYRLTYLLFI